MISLHTSKALTRHRFSFWELTPLLAAVVAYFAFPDYLTFAAAVLVMAMFALSLDLVIGFAGIVTLGHAVFYGLGAYVTALLSTAGWTEPVTALLLGAGAAAVVAAATGPFVLRLKGLPLIMVTVGICAIVHEAAGKASWLTGGHDGLSALIFDPVLGLFEWSIYGTTSYVYALFWLAVMFLVARMLVCSAFGVALQGIHLNELRMRVLGAPVLGQLVLVYTVSAFIAGLAGGLLVQINAFVSPDVLTVDLSVFALAMIVLGGIGRLHGALVGAAIYMSVQYFAQQWDPYYWMLAIGILLILVVRFGRGGLLGIAEDLRDRLLGGSAAPGARARLRAERLRGQETSA